MPLLDIYSLRNSGLDGIESQPIVSQGDIIARNSFGFTWSGTTLVEVWSTMSPINGTLRCAFTFYGNGGVAGYASRAQIYKNSQPYGVYRASQSEPVNFLEDLKFEAGDKIQLYVKAGYPEAGYSASVNNLSITKL
ncbi:hypothetical protein HF638_10855 [Paenibacillus sp. SZ31]|uniref:hypothetical protein n=1 Tax=Paenibacillus sp. SZ31 TaxID=2725555 RepID=UPI00146A6099|nr:hypothetical protein [Paenibacillus sp. SZ31]NMI04479.1 hypothetical protein [Paenibacillus sp. SZ31]